MQKKQLLFKTKGMNQDLSVSAFNPEFSFENRNLRLSTNDHNTTLSWVNEKGTEKLSLYIDEQPWKDSEGGFEKIYSDSVIGIPIGTAIIKDKLVLFTTQGTPTEPDHIYVFEYADSSKEKMDGKMLYAGNLGFDASYPLETLVSYEAGHIQKVYWTDGVNQPRLINIAATKDRIKKWHSSGEAVDTFFDFIPSVSLREAVTITKNPSSGGLFAPGVIQYCFSYINKNGQQTNIAYCSTLWYLSHNDRGASPEDKVSDSFTITIKNLDTNYDYLRLYSIQRTSLNAAAVVRFLTDIPTDSEIEETIDGETHFWSGARYTDTGTLGSSVDPTELLFVGGSSISALTMGAKDNTLFLGNIVLKNLKVNAIQEYIDSIRENIIINYHNDGEHKTYQIGQGEEVYPYKSSLQQSHSDITTFKGGQTYRFGFQLQEATGEWTDPIYMKDVKNDKYPLGSTNSGTVNLVYATCNIDLSGVIDYHLYKRIRPVVVYPSIGDREVLCQGVVNPTLFNAVDREDNSPFCQSSWYFRPLTADPNTFGAEGCHSGYSHYESLLTQTDLREKIQDEYRGDFTVWKNIEVQGSTMVYESPFASNKHNEKSNNQFFIDQSILTFHSPDLEFDTEVQSYSKDGLKFRIIGAVPITASISNHSITTKSAMLPTWYNRDDPTRLRFGIGELPVNVKNNNLSLAGRLVSDLLWEDSQGRNTEDGWITEDNLERWLIFPWQKTGSLNNDTRASSDASSLLRTKKESNLLFSINTTYLANIEKDAVDLYTIDYKGYVGVDFHLGENAHVYNMQLPRQKEGSSVINYYPNIDKVLYNEDGYGIYKKNTSASGIVKAGTAQNPVSMRYKSTSHALISLNSDTFGSGAKIPLLPYAVWGSGGVEIECGKYEHPDNYGYDTYWGDRKMQFKQTGVQMKGAFGNTVYDFLWLGELYKDTPNQFGGTDAEALKSNNWVVGGDAIDLQQEEGTINLLWTEGDTYYQRYDCMKTYPFSNEDENQLIEVLSFMCETHVNIDGRYDRNRGQGNILNISPQNFNQVNPVYSQQNNFFPIKKLNTEEEDMHSYPNQIYYTLTKESGADVDLWTHITLGSVLELEGDKGAVTSIQRLNNQLIAFQENGISQILYNENVQVSTEAGVPIEIANSGKVQGKRYLSDSIGCGNKWSIVNAPSGIYFMDNNDRSLYLFNGQLSNLSLQGGMSTWMKKHLSSPAAWNPEDFNDFVGYYDRQNQDVLYINDATALAWSERLSSFTSFYDYGSTPYFCNLEDTGIWIRKDGTLWKHQAGGYCTFFNTPKSYSMTLVGNPEPQRDKLFTNLEFRACVDGEGEAVENMHQPFLPFDSLETWNEYQHGHTILKNSWGHKVMAHFTKDGESSLKRKFRIWRCDIPRDDANKRDRMRNMWLYLKLSKDTGTDRRTEIHDIGMIYYD